MSEPERPPYRKKKGDAFWPVLLITLILLALVGAGIFFSTGIQQKTERPPVQGEDLVSTHDTDLSHPGDQSTSEPLTTATSSTEKQISPPNQPIEEPDEPEAAPMVKTEKPANQCAKLADDLHHFFSHIDQQDYILPFKLHEPSQTYFIALTGKLLDNPPVVSRESDDLYTMLKNMAHFFRIIGQQNILLIKTILDRERPKIEDMATALYLWTAMGTCENDQFEFRAPLNKLYEYAGFFLNTMGGRSYLFRRDSRSRLLINYYSILIIDRANGDGMNKYGIDISPIIPRLIQEIEASNQLIYKENYLDQLYDLREKYQ